MRVVHHGAEEIRSIIDMMNRKAGNARIQELGCENLVKIAAFNGTAQLIHMSLDFVVICYVIISIFALNIHTAHACAD